MDKIVFFFQEWIWMTNSDNFKTEIPETINLAKIKKIANSSLAYKLFLWDFFTLNVIFFDLFDKNRFTTFIFFSEIGIANTVKPEIFINT